MKNLLYFYVCLCSGLMAVAQKKDTVYVVKDKFLECKYTVDTLPSSFIDQFNGYFGGSYTIPYPDTIWALSLVYRGGREYYARYFNHQTKQMEEPQYAAYYDTLGREIAIALPEDTINAKSVSIKGDLSGIVIDTNRLYEQVRHLKINFWSNYYHFPADFEIKRAEADSIDFRKEWDLFVNHLGKFKNLKNLVIIMDPALVTRYLNKEFYLPPAITRLKKLEKIALTVGSGDMEWIGLPMELLQIKQLKELRLQDINCRNIELLASLKQLTRLRLISCSTLSSTFPVWLYDMKNLKGLTIDIELCSNNIKIGKLRDQFILQKTHNHYDIPAGISKLRHLESLTLGRSNGYGGYILNIPTDEICAMKKLKFVQINSSRFFNNEYEKDKIKKSKKEYAFSQSNR